jgi:hypothetical protein
MYGQGGGNPEAQARQKQQLELEAATPKLQITEEVLPLTIPGHTIGETEGVSRNSKGHLFVYSRTGTSGSSRGGTAAELFEFDENLKFVKMWGPGQLCRFLRPCRARRQIRQCLDGGRGFEHDRQV